MRKTIHIDDLKQRVNGMLLAEGGTHDGRIALCVLLEGVLMDSGNYRGFQFVERDGSINPDSAHVRPGEDAHSRRHYY